MNNSTTYNIYASVKKTSESLSYDFTACKLNNHGDIMETEITTDYQEALSAFDTCLEECKQYDTMHSITLVKTTPIFDEDGDVEDYEDEEIKTTKI